MADGRKDENIKTKPFITNHIEIKSQARSDNQPYKYFGKPESKVNGGLKTQGCLLLKYGFCMA